MVSENSVVLESASTLRERGSNALDGSRVVATARDTVAGTTALVRESFFYHWLTKEPDPEVVVIDLRETRTVGPVIAGLDRLIDALAPIYRESRLDDVVRETGRLAARASDTRLGCALAALFAPPDPPEADDTRDD